MAHLYLLSIDLRYQNPEEIKNFLIEERLINNLWAVNLSSESEEQDIVVEVSNKDKFERYLKRRRQNRKRGDPVYLIKAWDYKGIVGVSEKTSKTGKMMAMKAIKMKERKMSK